MHFTGTPAFINAIDEPQVEAIDVEPFDSSTSDVTRIVYPNSSCDGSAGTFALSAKAPCPTSRLPGPLRGFTSPTEKPGNIYLCI